MNYRLPILFFLIALTTLVACKKNYIVANTPAHPPGLNVINATADSLDFFINGTRQNIAADITPGGATYYLSVLFGTGNYSFKKAGSVVTLFSMPETLDTAADYTLFVCGESADKSFIQQDFIPDDTVTNTSAVRFVNASPNAGAINIAVSQGTSVSLTNCAFKYISNFLAIKDTINEVKVYNTSTGAALLDTTFTFLNGETYTLFTQGTPGGKGNSAFSMVQLVNQAATQVQ
jgi:hypothetical protein